MADNKMEMNTGPPPWSFFKCPSPPTCFEGGGSNELRSRHS